MPYIIGLDSGSSFDGIDAVLCTIDPDTDGHPTPRPRNSSTLCITRDWPGDLQASISTRLRKRPLHIRTHTRKLRSGCALR